MEVEKDVFVPPDGGYGWVIVLATTLINITMLPLVQCFGIIFLEKFQGMDVSSAKTSFLLHLHTATYCTIGLLASPLLKKYDFRRVAFIGTSLMSFGILLCAFAESYGVLIFTFSILFGVGQGIMLPATYLATNTYFKKRLTLAVSFSVTGASISYIFMPQIIVKLLDWSKSSQFTILILAALSLYGVFSCFLLRPIKKEKSDDENDLRTREELELLSDKERIYNQTTVIAKKANICTKFHELFNLELMRDRPYLIAIIGMSISFAAELNVILMIPFILFELADFAKEDIAIAMSIQSIADIIGRLGIPLIGHFLKIHPKIMYCSSLILATIGRTVIALFFKSTPVIFSGMTLIGLAKGIKAVYQSVIIPLYVPLEKLPAANGLNMLLTGAASLTLGPIIGAIHDVSGSYTYALYTGSAISMFCPLLWFVHFLALEKKN